MNLNYSNPTNQLPKTIGTITEIRIGQPKPFARGQNSSIDKQPIPDDVQIDVTLTGLQGDQVADTRFHGGTDKAVHCYSQSHYEYWRQLFPEPSIQARFQAGGFGENLCIQGIDESQICIGDKWQIGSAEFEISQGRQPCWKLNERFGVADMALRVQNNGRCGWYLRVLKTGKIQAHNPIILLERPFPTAKLDWILETIDNKTCEPEILKQILAFPLAQSWKNLFENRLKTGVCEDWQRRLFGQ